ncbi:MAG: GTP-binding protein [Burkholderiaceae bacterium]|nr:MAG: GTP-binding protein [Burkholderiaceae bacterium]
MRVQRLRLSQIRRFRGTLEIPDLSPGINLFCGPNETGKSTIARAIRAAFFERYRSSVLEDLLPKGEVPTSCSPTVEISFESGGQQHTLLKTFFAKKRCAYTRDGEVLDGEEAEEAISRLLGFGYAGKGASKPEHWGIPGLLWIEQGDGHRIDEPVESAADYLRTALESTVGAVASTAGDDVLATLREQRDQLLTPGTGRPRGAYQETSRELAEVRDLGAALDAQIAAYRDDVDCLTGLRAQHDADAKARPWEVFKAKLEGARQELVAAERLQGEHEQQLKNVSASSTNRELLAERLRTFSDRRAMLARRQEALVAAKQALEAAQAAAVQAEQRRDAAARVSDEARTRVALAEAEEKRRTLNERLDQASSEAARLEAALAKALEQAEELARHNATVDANRQSAADVEAAVRARDTLREREILQSAAATAITIALLPEIAATLDGKPVDPNSEHRITATAQIQIEGVGSIGVRPGDSDVADLARQVEEARAAAERALAKLGVASVEEARSRQDRFKQAQADAKAAEAMLGLTAPQGVDKLRSALAAATQTRAETANQLQALTAAPGGQSVDATEARAANAAAIERLEQASDAHLAAAKMLATAQAGEQAAAAEVGKLREAVDEAQSSGVEDDTQALLAKALADQEAAKAQAAELAKRIEQSQPDVLRQDVQRLQSSMEQSLATHNQRGNSIAALEARLEVAGANGIEEQREELRVREQALSRRLAELQLRAKALSLLVERLETKRQALTAKLQAPLQARLDHYMRLLFPGARLGLQEDLTPAVLERGVGTDAVDFGQLSHGAREQIALISRLAYADLLKEAGKPTLILLDDALVNTDSQRLDLMQRVLYDAAQRHQMLLFTCHPERWAGLGVPAREVAGFVRRDGAANLEPHVA